MFNQYTEPTNYMTYDSSSLNQYSYKNMDDVLPVYQQYENLYHFTRQINPITLSNSNRQTLDPTNLPCDIRPMIYAQGEADNNELLNLHRTRENNPNNWQDLITSKPGYYDQNEHTNNYYRPKSSIQAGQASSNQDIQGYLLF